MIEALLGSGGMDPGARRGVGDARRGARRRTSVKNRVEKSDAEWREELGEEAYRVLRQKGTERPFTGEYDQEKTRGIYRCRGCGAPLFSSDTKYDSGSGWPSFYEPVDPANVREEVDRTHFMTRTEVLCASCGGH
jgi:peptide-methionine (R)-S-oxide reductase